MPKRRRSYRLSELQRQQRYAAKKLYYSNPDANYDNDRQRWKQPPFKPRTPANIERFGLDARSATDAQLANRAMYGYVGRGDYRKWLGYGARGLGAMYGGMTGFAGGSWGGAMKGAMSGWTAGAEASKAIGWGDYAITTKGNQLMTSNELAISVNQLNATGDIMVCKTEFLQNIVVNVGANGQSNFEIRKFPINVGLSTTFPFLSQISQNFEQYELQGLIFYYKPTSGESSSNASNAIGKVVLATNYDPDAGPFLNSVQMENYDYANSGKPSLGIYHGVETHPNQETVSLRYVRTGESTKEKVFTDVGNFFLATEGIPGPVDSEVQIGELWVAYCCRLSKSSLYSSLLGGNVDTDFFQWTHTTSSQVLNPYDSVVNNRRMLLNIGCTLSAVVGLPKEVQITFPVNISLGFFKIKISSSLAVGVTGVGFDTPTSQENLEYYLPGRFAAQTLPVFEASNAQAGVGTSTIGIQEIYVKVQAPGTSQASITLQLRNLQATGGQPATYFLTIERANGFEARVAPLVSAFV